MNLQVQTKTQSRFSATPATPETLGALRPAGRLAIQCRKMEREEPKRKGSSDPLKELLPTGASGRRIIPPLAPRRG